MLHLIWKPLKLNIASEWLGCGFKYFYFQRDPRGNDPIWLIFFQMGWFNHHLDEGGWTQTNPEATKDEIQTVLPPRMTVTWKKWLNVSNPWDFGTAAQMYPLGNGYIIPPNGKFGKSPSKRPAGRGDVSGNPGGLLFWKFLNSFTFPISSKTSEFSGNSGFRIDDGEIPASPTLRWELTSWACPSPPICPSEKTPEIVDVFSLAGTVSGIKALQKSFVRFSLLVK